MTLNEQAMSALAIGATVVAALSLVWTTMLSRRLRRVRRRVSLAGTSVGNGAAALAVFDEPFEQDLVEVRADLALLRDAVGHAVQRVGLVRFDAFEDMGGRLSFAVALLDAAGDGIVLSSINGRTDTRIYAKPVERGVSRYNLSAEEEEAIQRALGAVRS